MSASRCVGIFLVALAWIAAPPPASAQRWSFQPEVDVDAAYSDNVLYTPDTAARPSDWTAVGAVSLELRRESPRNRFALSYNPSYEKHRDVTFLDHAEHRFRVAETSRIGRTASLDLAASWSRTQVQGVAASLEAPDLFLVGRTQRDLYGFSLGTRVAPAERWRWEASASGTATRYEAVRGVEGEAAGPVPENRNDYEARFGFSRVLSRSSELGPTFRVQRYDLEGGGGQTVGIVEIDWRRSLGRDSRLEVWLGGFRQSSLSEGGTPAADDTGRNGLRAGVALTRQFRPCGISLSAEHGPSSGGALQGTSVDTLTGLSVSGTWSPTWRWSVSARYAYRDPTLPDLPSVHSLGEGFVAEWVPRGKVGVRISGDHMSQDAHGGPAQEISALEISVSTARIGMVWYPRGQSRPPEVAEP